jgi:hypothetical protein
MLNLPLNYEDTLVKRWVVCSAKFDISCNVDFTTKFIVSCYLRWHQQGNEKRESRPSIEMWHLTWNSHFPEGEGRRAFEPLGSEGADKAAKQGGERAICRKTSGSKNSKKTNQNIQ